MTDRQQGRTDSRRYAAVRRLASGEIQLLRGKEWVWKPDATEEYVRGLAECGVPGAVSYSVFADIFVGK